VPPPPVPQRFDVLVVEDDRALRDQLVLALTDEGFTVGTAGDGHEALRLLTTTQVELVVLDLMLPGMSGRELATQMRATPALADVPLLMITGVGNVDQAPPGPVYVKPLRRESFLRAVRLHLERARSERRR
jgi:DNA-binding response OmpR family regulator